MRTVPNQFPHFELEYRIALIGEAPGSTEEVTGTPFAGMSGQLLDQLLTKANIARGACFTGNICQVRPPANDIRAFKWDGPEITAGLEALERDLVRFQPNLCVLLGNTALTAALMNQKAKIGDMRGTLFLGEKSPFLGRKCMGTFHPAALIYAHSGDRRATINVDPEKKPIVRFDLIRAREEGLTPQLVLPDRTLAVPEGVTAEDWFYYVGPWLRDILECKRKIALDIEGGIDSMSCISFAVSADSAFIVPFTTGSGPYWPTADMEGEIRQLVGRVLADPDIPKVLQNSLYDNFVLSYSYKSPILGVVDDTMLKHWSCFAELEKNLGFQASIYTKEPFYKSDRKSNDLLTFWRYCCRDSAVTYEINEKQDQVLNRPAYASAYEHYKFNVAMLTPILYMELRGLRYATEKAIERREAVGETRDLEQAKLDALVGHPCNIRSTKFKDVLYKELKLPAQFNRKTGSQTTNYEALVKLVKATNHPVPAAAIRIAAARTRYQMLGIYPDEDGRIRCGYNVVGSDTGRLTCYTSPTGSGYNLQTIPEEDRDLITADEGCWMGQADLRGADGWTVAAHCAANNDPAMLLDLRMGLKIPKALVVMLHDSTALYRSAEDLLKLTDTVSKSDPLYFAFKCVQHESNYGAGPRMVAATIYTQSEGQITFTEREAAKFQTLYFRRYPGILRWHRRASELLRKDGFLVSASGSRRMFFGHRNDAATLRKWLAHEPQANTTYATNRAMWSLWHDPENRREDGSLVVEPLHQVHDALVLQWRKEDTAWAKKKVQGWFDHVLVIAGQQIVIPYEGSYGDAWGGQREGTL